MAKKNKQNGSTKTKTVAEARTEAKDEATAAATAAKAEVKDGTKGRSLVTKGQKQAAKKTTAKKNGNGESSRVAVPTLAHFDALDEEIQKQKAKAFRTYANEDFVTLRALYDRGYRWARKLYEGEDLLEQSKIATKAAQKAAKDAEKASA